MTLLFVVATVLAPAVWAHVRFENPEARSAQTGIKGPFPCGQQGFFQPDAAVTTLTPGRNTIRLFENVFHRGAPMRLSLSMGSDDAEIVLATHIPHPDNAKGGSYMLDLSVDIPDVKCDQCALHLLSIMTDKLSPANACCSYPTDSARPCQSVYHSCANIKIDGTGSSLPLGITDEAMTTIWAQGEGMDWVFDAESNVYSLPDDWTPVYKSGQCVCDGDKCALASGMTSGSSKAGLSTIPGTTLGKKAGTTVTAAGTATTGESSGSAKSTLTAWIGTATTIATMFTPDAPHLGILTSLFPIVLMSALFL